MNKHIDLIKRQVAQLLKDKGQRDNCLDFINIDNGLIKILYNKKFVMYMDLNKLKDIKQQSKEWIEYKNRLANSVINNIKKSSKITNIICLISVWRGHNLLDKCIVSLKKQTMVPHIILLVSSPIDKNFAITRNIEFVEVKNNILGNKLQKGIKFIESNYQLIYGVIICSGFEIFTENWVKECFTTSSKYDIVGQYEDYIISSFSDSVYKRTINQKKYRNIVTRPYRNKYIMGYGRYIKKSVIDKLHWRIFSEKDNVVDIASYERLCQGSPSIGVINKSSMITIYQGQDFDTHVKLIKVKQFLNIEKIDTLPKDEDALINRLVIKTAIANTKVFMKPNKTIKPHSLAPVVDLPKKPKKLVQNLKPIRKLIEKQPVKSITEVEKVDNFRINGLAKPKRIFKGKFKKQIILNDYFDHIFVINLDKQAGRMKKLEQSFKKYNIKFERVTGIDGTNPRIVSMFKKLRGSRVGNSEAYGSLISHIKTVELARKKGYGNILIFEDDMILHTNFNKMLNKFSSIPENWDIIYLGCNNDHSDSIKTVDDAFYTAKNITGSFAYALSNKCYSEVLRLWKKQDQPVDKILQVIQSRNNSYIIHENLVISNVKMNSLSKRNITFKKKNLNLNNYEYIGNSPLHKISIVLPTYNGFPLIQRCINGIKDQSYQNWELIIVNDGSTDKNLMTFLNSIKSWKIKVINLQKNMGLPYALNRGLEQCSGNYWTWISDDNEFTPECFLHLKTEMDKGYQFVYSNFYFVNELADKISTHTCKLEKYTYKNIILDWKGMACYMWKMSAIKKIGMFNENFHGIEDFDYVIRTFVWLHGSIGFIERVLLKYYRRNNTITTRLGNKIPEMKQRIIKKYNNVEIFRKLLNMMTQHKDTVIHISGDKSGLSCGRSKQIMYYLSSFVNCLYVSDSNKFFEESNGCGNGDSNGGGNGGGSNELVYINKTLFNDFLEFFIPPHNKVILYYSDPKLHNYKEIIDPKLVIFDFIDPIIGLTGWNHTLKIAIDGAHVVTCPNNHFKNIVDRTYKHNNAVVVPNCYQAKYTKRQTNFVTKPISIRNIKNKTIIGFCGLLDNTIDYVLLEKIANIKTVHLVIVSIKGSIKKLVRSLRFPTSNSKSSEANTNITIIDTCKEDEIDRFIRSFDICLVPFKNSEFIYPPVIFYRYLYLDKPVIYTGFDLDQDFCYFINKDDYQTVIQNVINEINKINYDNSNLIKSWEDTEIKRIVRMDSKKTKKVVLTIGLVGNFGFGDYGNELVQDMFEKTFSNCQFVIMRDLDKPPYFTEPLLIKKINQVDIIIISGDLIQPNSCSNLYWNRKFLRKPVYIYDISLDYSSVNMVDNHAISKLKNFMIHNNVKYISTQDRETKQWIFDHIGPLDVKCSNNICFNFDNRKHDNKQNSRQENKILGLVLDNYTNLDSIINLGNYAIEKGYRVYYIELSTKGVVKNISTVNGLSFDKKIVTGKSVGEITGELQRCDIIFSNSFYPCLVGLVSGIPVVSLDNGVKFKNLYRSLDCIHLLGDSRRSLNQYLDKTININDTSDIGEDKKVFNIVRDGVKDVKLLKQKIIKNHIKIIHFGSYWQHENDIIKLMVKDMFNICETTEIDVKIYSNIYHDKWFDNIEPNKKEYPNKYVRYLKEDKIRELVENIKPHIIVTNSGGLTFTDDTFELLNEKNIMTVGLSMSDPDVFPYNGKIYANKYDYYFTNSLLSLKNQYDKSVNLQLMPFACSTNLHKPMNVVKKYDIVIVGGYRPDRIIVIDELKKHFNVGVFGSGWPDSYKAVKVNGTEHVMALNRGHIYISFGLTAAGYTNVKVGLFEAAACKLVLITNRTDEIKKYFEEDKEVVLYSTTSELVKRIQRLLNNRYEMSMFKKRSHERFLKDHTWEKRWKDILVKII